ncbi:F0F1 ATP synthase subunit A [Rhodohalobacter mucosus]|uniref:ATP synthase subunit a n=1 Tax=Rhodohalobacter mucosus TaxID=2079485 RepID=A0A316TQB0_9BACT|nr:F0F1 ATP synthase subunit A [Rhodohalobacter mucosus]PWN05988.1 F0F1 ATP synthase subunit A [Rhodohalobacter mucosus]
MEFNIDQLIYWQYDFFKINATLLFSWVVVLLLPAASWLMSRNLTSGPDISRKQALLESVVTVIVDQIEESTRQKAETYLPFIGTLFLFIVVSNVINVVPGVHPPTASLSTTAALAFCVFVAVPVFGIARKGFIPYFRRYIQPTPLMLPFNIIGELSRTLALAIRLFGNIMSGSLIVAILLSLTPLIFPVVMQLFGILIGVIQAYVFAILALVYIASATSIQDRNISSEPSNPNTETT